MTDKFKKYVEIIASQSTSDELLHELEPHEDPDFEGAYDSFIEDARELLK